MATYFTADQHFGHQNIIGYCGRPFHSVGEMNAVLVANWNAVVGPHDTVHVLGDVAMGRREESMPLIGRLTGHKILYPGNHDRCWYGHGERALRLEQEYLDAGFDEIRQGPLVMTVGNRDVLVCHLAYQQSGLPEMVGARKWTQPLVGRTSTTDRTTLARRCAGACPDG
ncbi:MAG: hypothetical protein M0020_03665 [Actinomycetota bacterium]|nr:hypothetical protein [Actinomycetota bacterium]